MKAIPYRLQLLEPVLVSQTETGEENSAIGLAFIPGSAVRGALVARYLEQYPTDDMAADPQARQWFLDGTVCFLNAYPWYAEGRARMLPTPMSWFTEKDRAADDYGSVCDWAVDPSKRLKQPKPPKDADFCHLQHPEPVYEDEGEENTLANVSGESTVSFYTPPRQVNVHIALVDPNRRGDSNKVYRYDALAAGEVLAGVIIAPDDADLSKLHTLLCASPDLFLGGAHTAGYGHVRLEVDDIVTGWEEYPSGNAPAGVPIIVTLLSDILVRGPDGQVNGDLDSALADLLGLEALRAERRYQRVALVGGFNRKWGLPLPQAWALQAGSVYVYPNGAFEPRELRCRAARGIGERRAEGFGRIAVNWHTTPTVQQQKRHESTISSPDLSAESKTLARDMAQRRLRLLLDRRLTEYLGSVEFERLPPNTQLSRVRNAVQRALATDSVKPVTEHLDGLKGAREQLERARVQEDPMLDWIAARIEQLDVAQQLLGGRQMPQIASEEADLDDGLKRTYTLRLIDGVMQVAARENQREGK